jgi:predicted ATPase
MQSASALLSGNLPAEPNSFIGRERDLAELARLLADVRALTLSGPGGIGKTRLAIRLARNVIDGGPGAPGDVEEAWLVELADWRGQTARHVAATIGVREEPGVPLAQTLAEALRSRHMLLILDTCEHQVGDCATLVQLLLARCPWLRIDAVRPFWRQVKGRHPPDGLAADQ